MTNREIALQAAKEVVAAKRNAEMNCLPFTLGSAADIICGVLDRCGVGAKRERKPVAKSPAKLPDDAWISSLETEPALAGVDVRREIGKAQFWCKQHRRLATRKFIINWLGKADRTLTVQMDGQTSKKTVSISPYNEPPNWRDAAVKLYPGGADHFASKAWGDVSIIIRKEICQKLLAS